LNIGQFDKFCAALPGASFVVQWNDSHVYKVGGKLFALTNKWDGEIAFILKTTPLACEILQQQDIATRAPYLTRGNWVRISNPTSLSDAELGGYIRQSYDIVAAKLPKTVRATLHQATSN
jgi:predicted DNA-binding protein (MmcQ/YjbR family)